MSATVDLLQRERDTSDSKQYSSWKHAEMAQVQAEKYEEYELCQLQGGPLEVQLQLKANL